MPNKTRCLLLGGRNAGVYNSKIAVKRKNTLSAGVLTRTAYLYKVFTDYQLVHYVIYVCNVTSY